MKVYEWVEDDTVPPGWKSRTAEGKVGKQFFLSPGGTQFATRTVALQQMRREDRSGEEVEVMERKVVELEGWQRHQNLPPGWLFKQTYQNKNVLFLSSEGDMHESFTTALQAVRTGVGYGAWTAAGLEQLQRDIGVERRISSYEWEQSDALPAGWRLRNCQDSRTGRQYFLSPTGLSFPSRFVAYRHLVTECFPAADQLEMRRCLNTHENWEESSLLPAGWNYKEDRDHGMWFLSKGN